MKYPKLDSKKTKGSKIEFAYDCGDLWERKNVDRFDDYRYCFDKDIKPFIESLNGKKIKEFIWYMHYRSSHTNQMKKVSDFLRGDILSPIDFKYKSKILFCSEELYLSEGLITEGGYLNYLIKLINHLEGINEINFGDAFMTGFLSKKIDANKYIRDVLKNPNWEDYNAFYICDPTIPSDLDILKKIKRSINKDIKMEFHSLSKEEKKILIKVGII